MGSCQKKKPNCFRFMASTGSSPLYWEDRRGDSGGAGRKQKRGRDETHVGGGGLGGGKRARTKSPVTFTVKLGLDASPPRRHASAPDRRDRSHRAPGPMARGQHRRQAGALGPGRMRPLNWHMTGAVCAGNRGQTACSLDPSLHVDMRRLQAPGRNRRACGVRHSTDASFVSQRIRSGMKRRWRMTS